MKPLQRVHWVAVPVLILAAILVWLNFTKNAPLGQEISPVAEGASATNGSKHEAEGFDELVSRIADVVADRAVSEAVNRACEEKRRKAMLWIGVGAGIVLAITIVFAVVKKSKKEAG
jgi:hypothetical protein